jgi:hypothetical protein
MMKSLTVFVLGIIFGISANAQKPTSGVFLTHLDFENKRLSYSTNDLNERNKIRFNEIFGKPFITVKHNGEKIILFKDEIFAYKKKGNIVRTHQFVSYNFIEKGVIWIYFKDLSIQLGKGVKRERRYFYSVSAKDEIIPLTINNLKKSFPDTSLFHNFLDAQFRSDSDLTSYNDIEKKFEVNHLLETTIFSSSTSTP